MPIQEIYAQFSGTFRWISFNTWLCQFTNQIQISSAHLKLWQELNEDSILGWAFAEKCGFQSASELVIKVN